MPCARFTCMRTRGTKQALSYVLLGVSLVNAMPTFEVAQAFVGSLQAILILYGGVFSKVSSM